MLQKSLYSLMLMDDVVREIDRLALQPVSYTHLTLPTT